MAHFKPRRNGNRTTRTTSEYEEGSPVRKRRVFGSRMLFPLIALTLPLIGSANLAWAVHDASIEQTQAVPHSQPAIVEPIEAEEPASAPSTETVGVIENPEPEEEVETVKGSAEKKAAEPSTPKAKPAVKKKTRTIHHNAYERIPLYRTVQHTKSVCTTHSSAEGTSVTWTSCAVCGGKHSHSYTEKVLDGYEEHFCAACGKKHSDSFDETIEE